MPYFLRISEGQEVAEKQISRFFDKFGQVEESDFPIAVLESVPSLNFVDLSHRVKFYSDQVLKISKGKVPIDILDISTKEITDVNILSLLLASSFICTDNPTSLQKSLHILHDLIKRKSVKDNNVVNFIVLCVIHTNIRLHSTETRKKGSFLCAQICLDLLNSSQRTEILTSFLSKESNQGMLDILSAHLSFPSNYLKGTYIPDWIIEKELGKYIKEYPYSLAFESIFNCLDLSTFDFVNSWNISVKSLETIRDEKRNLKFSSTSSSTVEIETLWSIVVKLLSNKKIGSLEGKNSPFVIAMILVILEKDSRSQDYRNILHSLVDSVPSESIEEIMRMAVFALAELRESFGSPDPMTESDIHRTLFLMLQNMETPRLCQCCKSYLLRLLSKTTHDKYLTYNSALTISFCSLMRKRKQSEDNDIRNLATCLTSFLSQKVIPLTTRLHISAIFCSIVSVEMATETFLKDFVLNFGTTPDVVDNANHFFEILASCDPTCPIFETEIRDFILKLWKSTYGKFSVPTRLNQGFVRFASQSPIIQNSHRFRIITDLDSQILSQRRCDQLSPGNLENFLAMGDLLNIILEHNNTSGTIGLWVLMHSIKSPLILHLIVSRLDFAVEQVSKHLAETEISGHYLVESKSCLTEKLTVLSSRKEMAKFEKQEETEEETEISSSNFSRTVAYLSSLYDSVIQKLVVSSKIPNSKSYHYGDAFFEQVVFCYEKISQLNSGKSITNAEQIKTMAARVLLVFYCLFKNVLFIADTRNEPIRDDGSMRICDALCILLKDVKLIVASAEVPSDFVMKGTPPKLSAETCKILGSSTFVDIAVKIMDILNKNQNYEDTSKLPDLGLNYIQESSAEALYLLQQKKLDPSSYCQSAMAANKCVVDVLESKLLPKLLTTDLGSCSSSDVIKRIYTSDVVGPLHLENVYVFLTYLFSRLRINLRLLGAKSERLLGPYVAPLLLVSELLSTAKSLREEFERTTSDDAILSVSFEAPATLVASVSHTQEELRVDLTFNFSNISLFDSFGINIPSVNRISDSRILNWKIAAFSEMNKPSRGCPRGSAIYRCILVFWSNVSHFFEGVKDCTICYSMVHSTNRTLPGAECDNCSQKFHQACLDKWFNSSYKTVCPYCQLPFKNATK
eukprot:GHVP01004480.1.p1 GENE.GHVP01004480.1~~GHVP01004480.1.p1  ORF type:complete len:1137 (+),score=188.78 GHVP01004480.1:2008-5418(+)